MKKKLKLPFLILLLGILLNVQFNYAQCSQDQWAEDGTYEIIQVGKYTEILSDTMLCFINRMRDPQVIITYKYSENTEIKIYPTGMVIRREEEK